MLIIKNSKELAKLVDKNKDLSIDEDVRIEFEPTKEEIRDVKCYNLYMENDKQRFDFNGRYFNGRHFNGWNFNGRHFNGWDFNGWDFNGRHFNGWNFNGRHFNGGDFNGRHFNGGDFNGRHFNGWNFNGGNFKGGKISYYAFFICRGSCTCTSWESRREKALPIQCLDGELRVTKEDKVKITCEGKE